MASRSRASTTKYISFRRSTGRSCRSHHGGVQGGVVGSPVHSLLAGGAGEVGALVAEQHMQGLVIAAPDDDVGYGVGQVRTDGDGAQVRLPMLGHDVQQVRLSQRLGSAQERRGDLDRRGGEGAHQAFRRIRSIGHAARPVRPGPRSPFRWKRVSKTSSNSAISRGPWASAPMKNRSVTSRSSSRRRALEGSEASAISSWSLGWVVIARLDRRARSPSWSGR